MKGKRKGDDTYSANIVHVLKTNKDKKSKKIIKRTFIYIISNPVFPGWYKIGKSDNVNKRLQTYQTYDPNRGYILEYSLEVKDISVHEKEFYKKAFSANEWVKGFNLSYLIYMIRLNEGLLR